LENKIYKSMGNKKMKMCSSQVINDLTLKSILDTKKKTNKTEHIYLSIRTE